MKYIDEYRNAETSQKIARAIAKLPEQPHTIMEVCGGQTHTILKYGLQELLPPQIFLLHGPGCPVCVTPTELIDKAIEIASLPEVIFCSFGDMLRVPGSDGDLLSVKAQGGDVRTVYSPLDALSVAQDNRQKEVVFFAIGFETTAPTNAMAVYQAERLGVSNFSLLVSQVLIPPAIEAILSSPDNRVEGFLAPGHVCTVTGYEEYERISHKYQVPIVITGFEPVDILAGIYHCVKQLAAGRAEVENQYSRSVRPRGNQEAQRIIREVFRVVPRNWRGIGEIPGSGLGLKEKFLRFDAEWRFGIANHRAKADDICISGAVLQGIKKPNECPAFASICTPETPRGATMVSSEGACAAYYRYSQNRPISGI